MGTGKVDNYFFKALLRDIVMASSELILKDQKR